MYLVDNYIQSAHILAYLPEKLTELAKTNKDATLELLRAWGLKTKSLDEIWLEVNDQLNADSSIHIPKREVIVKEDPESSNVIEEIYSDGELIASTKSEKPLISTDEFASHVPKEVLEIIGEVALMRSQLPGKIADISYRDEEKALEILVDWGNGKKPISALWDTVTIFLDEFKEK